MPVWLYRIRLGWLLGSRFLLLTHVGRKSGTPRRTVLEVVRLDRGGGRCVVASGWGEKAHWLRNAMANPEVEVTLGVRTRKARARRMDRAEAKRELLDYARRHPRAIERLARMMLGRRHRDGEEDFELLAAEVPLLELRFENATGRSSSEAIGP